MSDRIGVSGCFGDSAQYEPIDTVEEASAVVGELEDGGAASPEVAEESMLTIQELASVAQQYARRIRILTYGLIAVVAYLVAKELNK